MKNKCTYERPDLVYLEMELTSVLCSSVSFGEGGRAGDDFISGDDISNYGEF